MKLAACLFALFALALPTVAADTVLVQELWLIDGKLVQVTVPKKVTAKAGIVAASPPPPPVLLPAAPVYAPPVYAHPAVRYVPVRRAEPMPRAPLFGAGFQFQGPLGGGVSIGGCVGGG